MLPLSCKGAPIQQKATYKYLTCDLIATFNSTVKSYKPPESNIFLFFLLSAPMEDGYWDKYAP